MIYNKNISLNPESKERMDAVNTIKYTLLLDYSIPENDNENNIIDNIIECCRTCCSGLFEDGKSPRRIAYRFFGIPGLEERPDLLQHLDYEKSPKEANAFKQYSSISDMILQHCIISCYHAFVTDLFSEQTITSYSLVNIIKKKGIQYLRGNVWNVKNDQLVINTHIAHNTKSRTSSLASDFNRIWDARLKAAPGMFDFFKSDSKFNFATGALCSQIKEMKLALIKSLFSDCRRPDIQAFSAYNNIIENLYNFSTWQNKVDMIYQNYLVERIFDIHLLYCLIRTIKFTEAESQYRFQSKEILDTLAACQQLPNAFSRQLFVRYAFDHIFSSSTLEHTSSYNDYWLYHDPDHELDFTNIHTRKMPNIFSFPKWLEQYQLFMGYMSQFIIPVYEWCFVNMLLETIERKYPDRGHTYHLYQGIELLASYMDKNSDAILTPIIYEKSKDPDDLVFTQIAQTQTIFRKRNPQSEYPPQKMSITKKMDWLQFDDTLNDVFQILLSNFYSGNQDKELNLKLLNPSYFKEIHNLKTKKTINPYANTSYLRNCYIDLIRYDRLT